MKTRAEIQESVYRLLSERERYAYDVFCGSEQPSLAPSLNAKLYALFLEGKSTEEIRRLNVSLSLGQIVAARVEGAWDERRQEHLSQLLTETSSRVIQSSLQTTDFVCDLLAVANREHGDKLRRYLQTGDSTELGPFKIDSLGQLKTAIETLQKLTGQESQKKVSITGEVLHKTEPPVGSRLPTAEEAGTAIKLLLENKENN